MAASPVNQRTKHARSISLPSTSHPLVSQFQESLNRVQSSQATSVSSSSISQRLESLKELYDCVDSIFALSSTQQALSQDSHNREMVNQLLDGLLRLLDLCTAAKENLSTTKTCMQELQSAIRRRRGNEIALTSEIKTYLSHRKDIQKATQKALRNLKLTQGKGFSLMSENRESAVVIGVLREAESATFAVIESLMYFTSGQRSKSKPGRWSLVSKLIRTNRVSSEATSKFSEVEKVDAELRILMNQNTATYNMYEDSQKALQELETSIINLEEGIECLYRQLIKTRATLLNILRC
ncbi:hypothetical protein M9H77_33740 [Catharanthus roseus]|uniref:Uncharacterized protein n=1 Tax=Catharanthus roseus TaxID=4058 RepID=A0ACB9ZJI6_CATRO|nr:hypothetical protein M9H77_33740 [Catharanthus roseus]